MEPTNSSRGGRKSISRSDNFSIQEDENLCQAWVYINEDSIVGAGQRVAHYWDRIYGNFKQRFEDNNTRSIQSVQSRWGTIHRACNKWAGISSTVERTARSGTTIQDRLIEAKTAYNLTYKTHFILDHCWAILKDSPKWNQELEMRSPTTKRPANPDFDVDNELAIPTADLDSKPIDPFQLQVGDESVGGGQSGSGSGSGTKKPRRPAGTKGQKERLKKGVENERMFELLRAEMEAAAAERARADEHRARATSQMEQFLKLKQDKEDHKILTMDMSNLEPQDVEYFRQRKSEIYQRRRENRFFGASSTGGGSSGDAASN